MKRSSVIAHVEKNSGRRLVRCVDKKCELCHIFCMILTISSFDHLGSVMEVNLVYCVVMYTTFGIRGLMKNDYATEISSGLYHLVGANGTRTGNGNKLWFFETAFGCGPRKRFSCS